MNERPYTADELWAMFWVQNMLQIGPKDSLAARQVKLSFYIGMQSYMMNVSNIMDAKNPEELMKSFDDEIQKELVRLVSNPNQRN